MRRSNTRSPVLDRLVTNRELSQIKAHHLWLDLYLIKLFPRVNPNYATNHLGDHDHVPKVGFHQVGFLVGLGFLLGFAELFDQTHRFALEAAVESTTGTSMDDIAELFGGEIE